GHAGDRVIPVPADYDGDGKADISVKTPDGGWYIDYASNGFGRWDWSNSGYAISNEIPVGDYDGDGKADLVIKTSDGRWHIDYAHNGFGRWDASYLF
ncbi:MAG: FG-GAP-like repeat-containing protein, partial [Dysgonomonas sp.]|nr:FG-GAP-like repeat-containing protein [Dysgonomonas sp.]